MRVGESITPVAAIVAILLTATVARGSSVLSTASANTGSFAFNVPVTIAQVSDLYAFQFDIAFNPAVLELQDLTEGPFLPSAGITSFIPGTVDNSSGTAVFTVDTLVGPIPGASGSGTLALLMFQPKSVGTSQITLSNALLLDSSLNPIQFSMSSGTVVVFAPEPGAFIPIIPLLLLLRRKSKANI